MFAVCLLLALLAAVQGAVYTRWGRTTCADGASIIYTGYTAGASWNTGGSSASYVCLSDTPDFVNAVPGEQKWKAGIQGTKYKLDADYSYNNKPFSFANNAGMKINAGNAPCVVCRTSNRYDTVEVWGKSKCPADNMKLEYSGFVMTNFPSEEHSRTQYLCVDSAPEVVPGTYQGEGEARLYLVEAGCSTLVCPPYIKNYEVSCAVCTI